MTIKESFARKEENVIHMHIVCFLPFVLKLMVLYLYIAQYVKINMMIGPWYYFVLLYILLEDNSFYVFWKCL